MNKLLSAVFLIGGIVLIVYGVSAANSLGSGLSRIFTGSPTDKTIWLLVSGTVSSIVGLIGIVRS